MTAEAPLHENPKGFRNPLPATMIGYMGSQGEGELVAAIASHREVYLESSQFGSIFVLDDKDHCVPRSAHQARLFESHEQLQEERDQAHRVWRWQSSVPADNVRPPELPVPRSVPKREQELIDQLATEQGVRIFITGDGGSGKTECARHWTYHLALRLDPSNPQSKVPVFIRLASLSYNSKSESRHPLLLAIHRRIQSPLDCESFWQLLDGNRLVLILDGLDELSQSLNPTDFGADLAGLLTGRHRLNNLVLTGRPGAVSSDLQKHFAAGQRFELKALSRNQTLTYIRRYLGAAEQSRASEAQIAVERSTPALSHLLGAPFMLALTCLLFESGETELPEKPAALLDRALRCLLERRGDRLKVARMDDAVQLLSVLAQRSCSQQFELTSAQAEEALGELPQFKEPRLALARFAIHSGILCQIKEPTGIRYRFTNRVVAEYLAGCAIARAKSAAGISQFYSHHVWDSRYRRVLTWVGAELWRRRPEIARRICQWLFNHLAHRELSEPLLLPWLLCKPPLAIGTIFDRDDLRGTLFEAALNLLSGMVTADAEFERQISRDLQAMLPPGEQWLHWRTRFGAIEFIISLPPTFRALYRDSLIYHLQNETDDPDVIALAEALVRIAPECGAVARDALLRRIEAEAPLKLAHLERFPRSCTRGTAVG